MTTLTDSLPYVSDSYVSPSKLGRVSLYKGLLLLPMLAGMVFSLFGLKGVFDASDPVAVYGAKSFSVTYPLMNTDHFFTFIGLALLFIFLLAVIVLDFDTMLRHGGLQMFVLFAFAFTGILGMSGGLVDASIRSATVNVDSASVKAIVDSNLGADYTTVYVKTDANYVKSDGTAYEFVKNVEGRTVTWALEEVR
jgi:hypothetical protein